MAALAADRNTPRLDGEIRVLDVAASQLIYAGALVMRDASGNARKGATTLGCHGVGRAEERVDNSAGAAGDKTIRVGEGVFRWDNSSGGNQVTKAEIGTICYIVDDHTVSKTSNSNTRPQAGIVVGVDDPGVQVMMSEGALAAYLSNNKVFVQTRVTTLVGANSYYAPAPIAGRVTKIWSAIEGVLTTGDATLTAKINGTAITNGVLTVTQAGSAAGDVDSATPTAANAAAAGDALAVTVGGSNATATAAQVIFEITRD